MKIKPETKWKDLLLFLEKVTIRVNTEAFVYKPVCFFVFVYKPVCFSAFKILTLCVPYVNWISSVTKNIWVKNTLRNFTAL